MKRGITTAVAVVLAVSALAGCSIIGLLFMRVTQEEVDEAFGLTFGAYFGAALQIGFGGEVPGVTLDEATGTMTFTDLDVQDFFEDSSIPYTTMSGTFEPSDDETEIYADIELEGGPVSVIEYSLTEDFLNAAFGGTETATIAVRANYQDFTVTIEPE